MLLTPFREAIDSPPFACYNPIMPYTYLDHEADVGIRAVGATLEEALQEGAKAMLNVMWDIAKIEEREDVFIECEAADIPELFVETLNEILFKQDVEGLALARLKVAEIKKQEGGRYKLKGTAYGEPLDIDRHSVKTEVKAATYSGLLYEEKDGKHTVQCILDV
ncbi:MAG: archease [Deltaproteobacteria bacterium]|nr:archease [Deltaproteobacteria bacterium]